MPVFQRGYVWNREQVRKNSIQRLSDRSASGLNRDVTKEETSGSIACDGFVSALSSVFGCLPITSFSQNVGLVAMTKGTS